MRLAIILTMLITTAAALGIGLAAGLSVDSDRITSYTIDQAPDVPTPSPTPVPQPMTLYLDGTPNPDRLLDHQPGTQATVNFGLLGSTIYSIAPPGTVGSASNASAWQLTLVINTGLVGLNVSMNMQIYWQDGGSTCSAPVAGQIFATGSVPLDIPVLATNRGTVINIPATAGQVNHVFDADDVLCLSIAPLASVGGNYRTGVTSTSGVTGVMSNLTGPVYAP